MNPEWRTPVVRALCQQMLDSRDFYATPLLAEALQEAGCTDEKLLAECNVSNLDRVQAERLVNLVFSAETEAAVRWLEQFVRDINYRIYKDEYDRVGIESDSEPHDYARVIQVGHWGIKDGSMGFASDAGADFFRESADNRREFFRHWSLVTGVPAPEELQARISYGCAC